MTEVIRIKDELSQVASAKLVNLLNAHHVVIAPTDTVYGLIGGAFEKEVFHRLDEVKRGRNLPYVLIFGSISHLEDWYGELNPFQNRIVNDLLPGPVTLILPSKETVPKGFRHHRHGLGVRVVSDRLIHRICTAIKSPLWSTSANLGGRPAPVEYSQIDHQLMEYVPLVIDGGRTVYGEASTVIDIRRLPYKVLRRGPWIDRVESLLTDVQAPLRVLVVCTGNISRSPFGEALLKLPFGNPEESGIHVSSAGTYALEGSPAEANMILTARERGIDITDHRARQLTVDMLHQTDIVLVAEPGHRDWILRIAPEVENRIHLFTELINVECVPDPYGGSPGTFQQAAELIFLAAASWETKLRRFIEESGWQPLKERQSSDEEVS